MNEYSPTGKLVCPSVGPLDAKIVIVGESPAREEMAQGQPLVGPSGRLLNKALVASGIDRAKCYIMNLVPVRAPGDKFANHDPRDIDWGRSRLYSEISNLADAKVLIALGANPTEWLVGGKLPVAQYKNSKREGFISSWRGSVIQVNALYGPNNTLGVPIKPEDYVHTLDTKPPNALRFGPNRYVIPTFHPAAVLRQFNWNPWFLQDIQRAAEIANNGWPPKEYRTWYFDNVNALEILAEEDVGLISVDSELDPWIVGIATDTEVHVFQWHESFRPALTKILTNPKILKVAHRWLHDHAFFRKCLNINVKGPIFDLLGGMQNLNSALEKSLSPHVSTKFTRWPYHKWLVNVDILRYCGMDCVVTYDAYWPMMQQLIARGLYNPLPQTGDSDGLFQETTSVTDHDHKVLNAVIAMQAKGFKIDESVRGQVENELELELKLQEAKLTQLVQPVIKSRISKFEKPHLFQVSRSCDCCGGGSVQARHCVFCEGMTKEPENRLEWGTVLNTIAPTGYLGRKWTIKQIRDLVPPCRTCQGTGKITKNLEFNSDSPDQLADVLYRGLKIRPRRFKGKETVKAAQLDPLRHEHPIVEKIIEVSKTRAELDTVARLHAGQDGLLHCEFDPWGAETRMASREGLLEAGTNAQNLPKAARRFVVPREGQKFIYPDFAQIEARAMAVLSGDKNLRKALYEIVPGLNRPDYHTWLLNAINSYDPTISLSRDQSKRVSYAGFYGARPEQLAKELTAEAFRKGSGAIIDAGDASRILQTLYRVCPEVPRWQAAACDEVLRTRCLISPTGRQFPFPGYILDKAGELDYEIKKQIWSRLPQDMGSWVLGLGLIDIYTSPYWQTLLTPIIPVHDSLLIEVPEDRVQEAEGVALKLLTRYLWGMDWIAEVKKEGIGGDNWYDVS